MKPLTCFLTLLLPLVIACNLSNTHQELSDRQKLIVERYKTIAQLKNTRKSDDIKEAFSIVKSVNDENLLHVITASECVDLLLKIVDTSSRYYGSKINDNIEQLRIILVDCEREKIDKRIVFERLLKLKI